MKLTGQINRRSKKNVQIKEVVQEQNSSADKPNHLHLIDFQLMDFIYLFCSPEFLRPGICVLFFFLISSHEKALHIMFRYASKVCDWSMILRLTTFILLGNLCFKIEFREY